MSGHAGIRVLVVEEVCRAATGIVDRLQQAGCFVRVCPGAQAGLEAFVRDLPDLIVATAGSAAEAGFELVRLVRELSDVPIWLLVDDASAGLAERARELGVDRISETDAFSGRMVDAVFTLTGLRGPRAAEPRLTAAQVRRSARSELRSELERLLVECRGNLAEMARRMGKDRSTIRYHLRRFGMLADDVSAWSALSQSSPSSRSKAYSAGSPTSTS